MSHLILAALDPLGVIMTVVGLGGLIFFHELGHFIACRLTGTRVEAFSIGFGPEIFGWRRGHTRYRLAIIPLGGYVKMAAENPGEMNTGAADEFPNKSFSARLFIMSNGVIFNLILAFVLFGWGFGLGIPFPAARIGAISHGEAAWEAGVREGDLVTHVNGDRILSFDDLRMEAAFSSEGDVLDLTLDRNGETVTLPVTPAYNPAAGMPVIGVSAAGHEAAAEAPEDLPAAKAGGRAGDTIVAVDGVPGGRDEADRRLDRLLGAAPFDATEVALTLRVRRASGAEEDLDVRVPVEGPPVIGVFPWSGTVVRRIVRDSAVAGLLRIGDVLETVDGEAVRDLAAFYDGANDEPVAAIGVRREGKSIRLEAPAGLTRRALAASIAGERHSREGTRIAVRPNYPAERAGLRSGDEVLTIAGTRVEDWTAMQETIVGHGRHKLAVTVRRDGQEQTFEVEPAGRGMVGYRFEFIFVPQQETNFFAAVAMGWRRTMRTIESTILTIRGLVTARVSAKHVGGPIKLAEITYTVFDRGFAYYLYILALISINLAILNMLPIPVLDGGQIVLLCAEKIRGKPLPDRIVGYYQVVGLVLILALMTLAFWNDITGLLR